MIDTLGMFEAARAAGAAQTAARHAVEVEGLPRPRGHRLRGRARHGRQRHRGRSRRGGRVADCGGPDPGQQAVRVPEFVGPNTLVLAISFSGNTEETVDAVHHGGGRRRRPPWSSPREDTWRIGREVGGARSSRSTPRSRCRAPASAPLSVRPLLVLEQLGLLDGARDQVASAIEQR